MTDPTAVLRDALTHGRAMAGGDGFGVWLDPTAIRRLLEHCAQQDARNAQLVIERDQARDERDRARALVVALTSPPPDHHEEP